MSKYKNEAVVNYPVSEVFKVFKNTAKRDFPKFNDKNPVGIKVERQVGSYASKSTKMTVEITGYKINELYEITSTQGIRDFTSRYEFYPVSEDKTKIVLKESHSSAGVLEFINVILAAVVFRWKVRDRFKTLIKGLEAEIESNLKRMERSKPKG